jgi:hypothetical protein
MAFSVQDGFPEAMAKSLRRYALSCVTQSRFDGGYDIIEFWSDSHPLLTRAIDHIKSRFQNDLGALKFQQGWFFIYDSECPGVGLHADPAAINVNIWLTPNEAIADFDKNGLLVYDAMCPPEWDWDDYNTDTAKIEKHIVDVGATARTVQYAYRRMTLFDSRLFHKTNGVHTHPGTQNKRINCTLLFG